MPFGISSASEILQKRMFETFGNIDGAHIKHDDMIVAGDDEADHDRSVHKVMERANEKYVKINSRKTKFKVNKVKYCGNYVSADGLSPDPDKFKAVVNMPIPSGKTAQQRFLGMVKYLSQFIPMHRT